MADAPDRTSRAVTASRRHALWASGAGTALLLTLAALLVLGAVRVSELSEARRASTDNEQAVAVAVQGVTALITTDAGTSDEELAAVVELSTSGFREQLEAQADSLLSSLVGSNVTADGEVVSAGLVSRTDTSAEVVVAAKGTVTQGEPGTSSPRHYRVEVELQRSVHGWLVSDLEFV